jgi:hypothetical protein
MPFDSAQPKVLHVIEMNYISLTKKKLKTIDTC